MIDNLRIEFQKARSDWFNSDTKEEMSFYKGKMQGILTASYLTGHITLDELTNMVKKLQKEQDEPRA